MLVVIAGGTFLGFKLDQTYLNPYPFFTILFSIGSIIFSIYYTISQATKDD